jgi:alkyl sulfatase BDS1-like metallo-beta-lactamase superfamily hydrolase
MESIPLSKYDKEYIVIEAHVSFEAAAEACDLYNRKEQNNHWIKTVQCRTNNSMQQKLNLL